MKLAEALVMRADLQKRIAQMRKRMENSAWVQEGDQPAEEPEALVRELTALINQLEALMTRINLTNAQPGPDGTTVTALLARRDCLTSYVETMRAFLDEASSTPSRATRGEIRILPTVNIKEYRKKVDDLSRALREVDMRIQRLNWTTELL